MAKDQANGDIKMTTEKLQELPLKNGNPHTSEMEIHDNGFTKDDHKILSAKAKNTRYEISDSSSSLSSLSSISDDASIDKDKNGLEMNGESKETNNKEHHKGNKIENEDANNKMEMIRMERDEAKKELELVNQSNEKLQEKLNNTQDELNKTKSSNEILQNEKQSISTELKNKIKECEELSEKLGQVDKENEIKLLDSEESEKLLKVQHEVQLKEKEIDELRLMLDKEEKLHSEAREELKRVLEKMKLVETAYSEKVDKLKKELETADQRNKDNDDLDKLKDELESFKINAEKQQKEIVELTEQLATAKKDIGSKNGDENEVQTLKDELKVLLSKIETQEQEAAELEDQLELSKSDIAENGRDETSIGLLLREQLVNAKSTIRSVNQANSKLEARLSNAQTIIETGEVEQKKSKEEIKALKDKIKWLEKRREQSTPKSSPRSEGPTKDELERKLLQESLRRSQDRVRDLEQKVTQVNEEKQKLKHEYDEAVKALEAVDKVVSIISYQEIFTRNTTYKLELFMIYFLFFPFLSKVHIHAVTNIMCFLIFLV